MFTVSISSINKANSILSRGLDALLFLGNHVGVFKLWGIKKKTQLGDRPSNFQPV